MCKLKAQTKGKKGCAKGPIQIQVVDAGYSHSTLCDKPKPIMTSCTFLKLQLQPICCILLSHLPISSPPYNFNAYVYFTFLIYLTSSPPSSPHCNIRVIPFRPKSFHLDRK